MDIINSWMFMRKSRLQRYRIEDGLMYFMEITFITDVG